MARRLGLPASFTRECPLPFAVAGAVRFDNQAQFNPCKYLLGLADAVRSGGGHVFEGTRAHTVEHGEPCRISADQGVVTARDVIDATHMPMVSEGKFFAKAYPYAHAAVAARIDPARAPYGMFISTEQPTHSVRTARRGDEVWLVAVGGSFKPGHADEAKRMFQDLEHFLRAEFRVDSVDYYWTNEDYESMDRMPFVGRASSQGRGRSLDEVAAGKAAILNLDGKHGPSAAQQLRPAVRTRGRDRRHGGGRVRRGGPARAKSDAVKDFARRMVEDHSEANVRLISLAEEDGIAVPGRTRPGA